MMTELETQYKEVNDAFDKMKIELIPDIDRLLEVNSTLIELQSNNKEKLIN